MGYFVKTWGHGDMIVRDHPILHLQYTIDGCKRIKVKNITERKMKNKK